jgi:hypothetical protein
VNIGVIEAILRLRDEYSSGIRSAQSSFAGLNTGMRALGATLGALAIGKVAGDIVDAGSKIADTAQRIGISAEAVQKLKFAAEQGGGSMDQVATAMGRMANTMADPSKGVLALMGKLGLDIDAIKAMSPDQAFTKIADAIGKMEDPLQQAHAVNQIFGKGALDLLPAIKAGFQEVGAAAPVMSNATVKAADDMGDAWAKTEGQINALKAKALTPLLNLFLQMPESMQLVVGAVGTLAPSLQGLASIVMMAGGPVAAFTAISTLFTVTLPAAFTAILPFLGPIGILAVAIGAVVLVWKKWDVISDFVKSVYTAIKTWLVDKVVPFLAAAGPLLGPVGMVVTVWKNWDKISTIVQNVYTAVKTWLVDKFAAIVDSIKGKIDAVTGFFANMYDKVVGNSYVPDMILGIESEFNKLKTVMVGPAQAGVNAVLDSFKKLTSGDGLMSILNGFMGIVGGIGGIVSAARAAVSAIRAVWNAFRSEESRLVNDPRDAFIAQFGPGGTGEGSGFRVLANKLHELTGSGELFDMLASARTQSSFEDAVRRIEDALDGWRPGQEEEDGENSFAGGTNGFRNFGSGKWVKLHGVEAVVRPGDVMGGGARELTIPIYVGDRHIETVVVDVLSRAVRRRQPVGAV